MLEKEQKRKNKRAQKNQVQVNLQMYSFRSFFCELLLRLSCINFQTPFFTINYSAFLSIYNCEQSFPRTYLILLLP